MNATFLSLSDSDLLAQVEQVCAQERRSTAHLVALLMEVDTRKLYAPQGCSSLFTYCVQVLHFSEHAAYLRIEATRAARHFPVILDRLTDGVLHLTAVSLLAPHLTPANHLELLDAARHKTKREVEQLVARVRPQPDAPIVIRKLPTSPAAPDSQIRVVVGSLDEPEAVTRPTPAAQSPVKPPEIKPLAPERFKVQFTVGRATYERLRQVQDLLRHSIPDGDPALIFDRALTLLLADLSKSRLAAVKHPRPRRVATQNGSRHVPAEVRREVWQRDGGRCAFRGQHGRCSETGFLEFHHVVPFARGGAATSQNIELRCRAHNVYEAEQEFGRAQPWLVRETEPRCEINAWTRSGPSSDHRNGPLDAGSSSTSDFA